MSQSNIKNSTSFMSFAKNFKKVQIANCTNHETGEIFKALAFTDDSNQLTFVSFSSKLGELTAAQIAAQKDELQIVELESGNLKLCKQGVDTWETVDLGL